MATIQTPSVIVENYKNVELKLPEFEQVTTSLIENIDARRLDSQTVQKVQGLIDGKFAEAKKTIDAMRQIADLSPDTEKRIALQQRITTIETGYRTAAVNVYLHLMTSYPELTLARSELATEALKRKVESTSQSNKVASSIATQPSQFPKPPLYPTLQPLTGSPSSTSTPPLTRYPTFSSPTSSSSPSPFPTPAPLTSSSSSSSLYPILSSPSGSSSSSSSSSSSLYPILSSPAGSSSSPKPATPKGAGVYGRTGHHGAEVVPYTIFKGEGYLLLSKEGYGLDAKTWCGFGGGKHAGETAAETAARECWEESKGLLGDETAIKAAVMQSPAIGHKTNYNIFFMHVPEVANINQAEFSKRVFNDPARMEKTHIAWVKVDDVFQAAKDQLPIVINGQKEQLRTFFVCKLTADEASVRKIIKDATEQKSEERVAQ